MVDIDFDIYFGVDVYVCVDLYVYLHVDVYVDVYVYVGGHSEFELVEYYWYCWLIGCASGDVG